MKILRMRSLSNLSTLDPCSYNNWEFNNFLQPSRHVAYNNSHFISLYNHDIRLSSFSGDYIDSQTFSSNKKFHSYKYIFQIFPSSI